MWAYRRRETRTWIHQQFVPNENNTRGPGRRTWTLFSIQVVSITSRSNHSQRSKNGLFSIGDAVPGWGLRGSCIPNTARPSDGSSFFRNRPGGDATWILRKSGIKIQTVGSRMPDLVAGYAHIQKNAFHAFFRTYGSQLKKQKSKIRKILNLK